jgi:hypothetical protein
VRKRKCKTRERGERSEEVAEAIWLHPQIFFTLTTIWGDWEREKRGKHDSNHDVTMSERGEKRKLI